MTAIIEPKWYSIQQVAHMLGFSLSKTKMLVAEREIKSVKIGKQRRILLRWVDEFVQRKAEEVEQLIEEADHGWQSTR